MRRLRGNCRPSGTTPPATAKLTAEIKLSVDDQLSFADALINPPPLAPTMLRAIARHRRLFGTHATRREKFAMKRITLAEFEAGIEAVLDEAGTTPVMIVKDGLDHLVLLPVGHYERLRSLARYFGTGEACSITDRVAGAP